MSLLLKAPEGEEHGVVLLEELLELVVDAEAAVDLQLDAHAPQDVDLLVQEVARQAVARDAVAEHAARLGQGLEDLDRVPLEPGVEGGGEAGGPAAHDGDLLAGVGLGLDRQQQLARLLLVDRLVGHEAVELADGDGLLDELAAAGAFARPRADAPEHGRERQVLAQLAHAVLVVLVRDVVEELRDLDVRGAGVAAGRRAEASCGRSAAARGRGAAWRGPSRCWS